METRFINEANSAYWKFLQGFLLGQLILLLLLYLLIKYWFLDDSKKKIYHLPSKVDDKVREEIERKQQVFEKVKKSFKTYSTNLNILDAEILTKTYYDIMEHQLESCDWFNVLLAQLLHYYRKEILLNKGFVNVLEKLLNSKYKPNILGSILLTELSFGNEFPIFNNIHIGYKDNSRMYAEIELNYQDKITIGLDSSILMGIANISLAALPLSLTLSLLKFEGKIILEFQANKDTMEQELKLSILSDYKLELDIQTLLGHRSKLKDVPKIKELINARIIDLINQFLVEPNGINIKLPTIDNLFNKFQNDNENQMDKEIEEIKNKKEE
ncbi:hypothetical protein K502DRAFT_318111 [Neoconidiobolus thromboides FSU 785]|nr:hypothetical protein K502DRAFT_318111 [Neoconidiobolus thromboides FSU 785]